MPSAVPTPPADTSAHAEVVALDTAVGRSYRRAAPYLVSRAKIAEFGDALADPNPVYRDPAAAGRFGHPEVVAPPTFGIVMAFGLLEELLADPDVGLALHRVMHAEQKFTMDRPIRAGDALTAELTVERVRAVGDADLVFTSTTIMTEDAEPVGTAQATLFHHRGTDAGPTTEVESAEAADPGPTTVVAGDAASQVPAYTEVTAGSVLGSLALPVRRSDLVRYAGASGDFNPIHYNDRVARVTGLPGVIAHGMLTMAHAARLVTDWLGDPGRVVEYSTRFSKPVLVPDTDAGVRLDVEGTLAALLDDRRARIDLGARVGSDAVLGRTRAVVQLA